MNSNVALNNIAASNIFKIESTTLSSNIFNDTDQRFTPPAHLFSDYVEIFYLSIVIIVGTIINTHVLLKLIKEKRDKTSGQKSMVKIFL